jgi:hypothetical protein
MFMRYLGGGIGHKATDHIQPSTPKRAHEEDTETQLEEEGLKADDRTDHIDLYNAGTLEDERGSEGIDTDEEVDYGYGGSTGGEDSPDLDTDQEGSDRDDHTD